MSQVAAISVRRTGHTGHNRLLIVLPTDDRPWASLTACRFTVVNSLPASVQTTPSPITFRRGTKTHRVDLPLYYLIAYINITISCRLSLLKGCFTHITLISKISHIDTSTIRYAIYDFPATRYSARRGIKNITCQFFVVPSSYRIRIIFPCSDFAIALL